MVRCPCVVVVVVAVTAAPATGRISTSTPTIPAGMETTSAPIVAPDVEQDRALPGKRVLAGRGAHDACVVPGTVW